MNTTQIEADLDTLSESKGRWASLPVTEKIDLLHQIVDLSIANAEDWADDPDRSKILC